MSDRGKRIRPENIKRNPKGKADSLHCPKTAERISKETSTRGRESASKEWGLDRRKGQSDVQLNPASPKPLFKMVQKLPQGKPVSLPGERSRRINPMDWQRSNPKINGFRCKKSGLSKGKKGKTSIRSRMVTRTRKFIHKRETLESLTPAEDHLPKGWTKTERETPMGWMKSFSTGKTWKPDAMRITPMIWIKTPSEAAYPIR